MKRKNGQPYVYGTNKVCPVCGKHFKRRDADCKAYSPTFCSHACRNKSRQIYKEMRCNQCGEVFLPYRKGMRFCSRQCSAKYKSSHHVKDSMVVVRSKMASRCCDFVHRCLRGTKKHTRVYDILGYDSKDLIHHLEKFSKEGMSWENYGNNAGQWSIDHTRPISSFPPDTPIRIINALSNLRPMWHTENCSKGNTWEGR